MLTIASRHDCAKPKANQPRRHEGITKTVSFLRDSFVSSWSFFRLSSLDVANQIKFADQLVEPRGEAIVSRRVRFNRDHNRVRLRLRGRLVGGLEPEIGQIARVKPGEF